MWPDGWTLRRWQVQCMAYDYRRLWSSAYANAVANSTCDLQYLKRCFNMSHFPNGFLKVLQAHFTQHWLICISHLMINYSQITFNCQPSVSQWLHRVMQSDITAVIINLASQWNVSRLHSSCGCFEYWDVKKYLYISCSIWYYKKRDTHCQLSLPSRFPTVFLPYTWTPRR